MSRRRLGAWTANPAGSAGGSSRWRRPVVANLVVVVAGLALLGPWVEGVVAQQIGPLDKGRDELVAPPKPRPPADSFIGLTTVTNSRTWQQVLRRADARGALVIQVAPDSPAAKGGLAAGDVIVGIDGREVRNEEQVGVLLRSPSTAERLITVVRPDGQTHSVTVYPTARGEGAVGKALETNFAADASPANRMLYGEVVRDVAAGLRVLDGLVIEFPGFAPAHAARARRLLDAPVASREDLPRQAAQARQALARALEADPSALDVQLDAAQVLANLGDDEAAEEHAASAVEIDDTSARAHQLRGLAYLRRNNIRSAVTELLRAVELNPFAEQPYGDLSRSFVVLGRPELARQTDEALAALRDLRRVVAPGQPVQVVVAGVMTLLVGAAMARWRSPQPPVAKPARKRSRSRPAGRPSGIWMVETLAGLGAFSVAAPFLGRALGLTAPNRLGIEIRDSLVPGVVVLILSLLALRLILRGDGSTDYFHVLALATGAAGLWITLGHLYFLGEAFGGGPTAEKLLVHLVPGLAMLLLAVPLHLRLADLDPALRWSNRLASASDNRSGGVWTRSVGHSRR